MSQNYNVESEKYNASSSSVRDFREMSSLEVTSFIDPHSERTPEERVTAIVSRLDVRDEYGSLYEY